MKVLIGDGQNWQEEIKRLYQTAYLPPFSPVVLDFLHDLSKAILQDKRLRKFPELMALGFWLRKGNIAKLQEDFFKRTQNRVTKPRGVVLHFAPANVDTIFVYSWVLSLLAGNSNIIRVSQKENDALLTLVELIRIGLQEEKYDEIRKRLFVCTYEHNARITEFLSQHCHTRVIWGGDETVKSIRKIPLAPLANELVFADRFSLAAIRSEAVLEASEEEFMRLIHHFYNDAFTFDQMACSSPRLAVWVGGAENIAKARQKFWRALEQLAEEKNYEVPPAVNMTRLTTAFYYAAQNYSRSSSVLQAKIKRIAISDITSEVRSMHCGAGLFLEYEVQSLDDVARLLSDKDQTLVYYGFSKDELLSFVEKIENRAIDRIVPIGEALKFSKVWDGTDLLVSFTREIDLK